MLGASSELRYRQDLRNLKRCVTWEGIIRRKKKKAFKRFLEHPDPRIRRYAEELAAQDIVARELLRFLQYGDNFEAEDDYPELEGAAVGASPEDICSQNKIYGPDDDDIPF